MNLENDQTREELRVAKTQGGIDEEHFATRLADVEREGARQEKEALATYGVQCRPRKSLPSSYWRGNDILAKIRVILVIELNKRLSLFAGGMVGPGNTHRRLGIENRTPQVERGSA